MNNQKLILVPIIVTIAVASALLVLGPSTLGNAQAQTYDEYNQYGYDNNYNNYYPDAKSSHVEVQKISCINDNKNINGLDITEIPEDGTSTAAANEGAAADAANTQNGNGFADRINFDKNLVNICVNVNVNDQLKTSEEPSSGGDHPEG